MHKNNQTFPSDRSCSCRKENHFLRRKGGYCQWRGDLEWEKDVPHLHFIQLRACVWEKPAEAILFGAGATERARGQPNFPLCCRGALPQPWKSGARFGLAPDPFSIVKQGAGLRLLGRSLSCAGRPGWKSRDFLQTPALPTGWNNSQGTAWVHTFACPWSILQKSSSD